MNTKELTIFLGMLTTRLERELTILHQTLPAPEYAATGSQDSSPNLAGLASIIAELQRAILMLEGDYQQER